MNDTKQNKLDICYIKMAEIWASNSYALRNKVGALIVKDNRIISDGYNGTPTGFPNVCEYIVDQPNLTYDEMVSMINNCTGENVQLKTHKYVLHAEANAITKLAKSNTSADGATMYVTLSPCFECAKLIIQAGIIRVVYLDNYRDDSGLMLLSKANIEITKINNI